MSVLVEEAVKMVLSSVDDDTADLSTVLAHLDNLHLPNSDSAKAPLRMILALSLRSEPTWSARYSAHTGRPCRKWPVRRNAAIPLSPPPVSRDASLVSLSTSLAALSAEAARPPPASPPRPVFSRVPLVSLPLPQPIEAPLAMRDLGASVAPPRLPPPTLPVVMRAPPPPPPLMDYAAPLAALETLVLQTTATSLLAPVPAQPPKPPTLLSTPPPYTQTFPGPGLSADSLYGSSSSSSGRGTGKGVAFAGGSGDDNDVIESDTPAFAQSIHAIRDWSLGSGSQVVGPDGRVVAGFSPGAFSQWRTLGRSFKRWVSAVVFSRKAREVAASLEKAREATAAEWGRAKFMRRMFKKLVEGVVERRVERGKLCVALEHWSVVTQTKVVRAWAGVVAAERPIPLRNPVAIGALFHWITLTLPDRGVWWKPGAAAAMAASVRGLSISVPPPPHLYQHHFSRGNTIRGVGDGGGGGVGPQVGGGTWRVKDRDSAQREEGEGSSHHHHHHHLGSDFLGGVVSEDDSPWLYTEAEEADAAANAHVKRLDTLPSRVLRRIGPPPHKLHCLEEASAVVDGGLAASCFGAWRAYAAQRVAWHQRVVKGALSRVLVTWRRGTLHSLGVRGCGVRRCVTGAKEFLARLRVRARVNGAQRAECAVAEAVRTRGCVLRALGQWRGALQRVRAERRRVCFQAWRRECVLLPRLTAASVAHRERELLGRALGAWSASVREERVVWDGLEAQGVKAWGKTTLQRVRSAFTRAVAMREVVRTASQARRVNSLTWAVSQWRGVTGVARAATQRDAAVRGVKVKGVLRVWRGYLRGLRAGRQREGSVATLQATRTARALSRALLTLATFAKYAKALAWAHKCTLANVWRSRATRGLGALQRGLKLSRLATTLLTRRALGVFRAWAQDRLSAKRRAAALRALSSRALSLATLRALRSHAQAQAKQRAQALVVAAAHARATLLSHTFSTWRTHTQLRKARALSLSKALHTCQFTAPLKAALGSWREATEEAKLEAHLESIAQGFWSRVMKGRALHALSSRVASVRAWESHVVACTESLGRWKAGSFLRTLASRATARRAWEAHVKACQGMIEDWKVQRALGVWRDETTLLLRVRKGAMILAAKLGQAAEDRLKRVAWGAWVYRTQLMAIHSLVRSTVGARLTKGAVRDWRLAAMGKRLGREIEEGRAKRGVAGALETWRRKALWRRQARVCLTRVLVTTPRANALRVCLGKWFSTSEALGCMEGSQRRALKVWRGRVAWVKALRHGVGMLVAWKVRQWRTRALHVWRRRAQASRLAIQCTLSNTRRATRAALTLWQSKLAASQARKVAALALCQRVTRTSTLRIVRVAWGVLAVTLREAQSKGVKAGVVQARGCARVTRACFQALRAYALRRVGHRGALGAACHHMGQWKATRALRVWVGAIGAKREMRVRVADGLGLGRSRRLLWALTAMRGAVAVRKRGKLVGALARLHFEKVALPATLQALKDFVMRRRAGRAALGGLVSVVRGVVLRKGVAAWVAGTAAARECARLEAEAAERARAEAERVKREAEEAAERARLEAERVRREAEEAAERARLEVERVRKAAEDAAERARLEEEERVRKAAEEVAERARQEAERVRLEAEAAAALVASRLALLRRTFSVLRTECLREHLAFESLHEEGVALVRRKALLRGLKALLASAGRAVCSRALTYLTRQKGLRRGLAALWGAVVARREQGRVVGCVAAASRVARLTLALRRWCEGLAKARIARAAKSASTHLRLSRALGLWYTWLEGVRRAAVGAQSLARRRGKRGLAALGAHLDRARRDSAMARAAAAVVASLKVARAVERWRVATARALQLRQAERAAVACIAAARYTLALNTWRARHKATVEARKAAAERACGRVRGAFRAWVAATGAQKRLRILGEGFGEAMAQARGVMALRSWRGALRRAQEEASAVRRAGRHLEGVRGRKALAAWREAVGEARATRLARQALARRARAALRAWRDRAQYLSNLQGIAAGVKARVVRRVGVQALRVWRGAAKERLWEARATHSAVQALRRGLALRVLYAWWEVVREAKAARAELAAEADLRMRLEVLLARARARTVKLLFNAWASRVRVTRRARALARERVMHGPVKRCFAAWCKFTREHKALTLAAAELLERREFSLLGRAWDALVEAKDLGLGGGGGGGGGGMRARFVVDNLMGGRASPLLPDLRH